jgi:spoIIIJ-associated protein
MRESRASLEVIAASPEEAIEKGLADLGLSEDAVEIEILDPGSKGLFGIGSRQARVRLTIRGAERESSDSLVEREVPAAEVFEDDDEYEYSQAPDTALEAESKPLKNAALDDTLALEVARDTVNELLIAMKVRATVTAHYGTADDDRGRVPLIVDINGHDLSILIGPRAETLEALQYITNLIVGKELGRSIPLIVDVQGYRARREQQVRQLARRMADQAVKSGRRQVLEPMPASERRLVHIELRDNPDVFTESIGEDPRRKVTIIPKP